MRILATLLVILPMALQAQHKEEITSAFNEYFAFMEKGEFTKSLDYLPSQFFDVVPRAQMEAAINQTFNNPSFSIQMDEGAVTDISDEVIHEDVHYATMDYSNTMTISLAESAEPQMFSILRQSFEQQVGAENMTVNEEAGTIRVSQASTMYAIKNPDGKWRFVEKNPQLGQILEQIIPAEVREKL